MAGLAQIRGMLLEEIVLHLLESNGYATVGMAGVDPTLKQGPSGLYVRGRGTDHQVDAIAGYRFTPPFSHPYRLLVEAKSLGKPVGLSIVRNAVGVFRDVGEFWRGRDQPRFHYQYAVFADTAFTIPAQSFGYVQDIFLLPLGKARSMQPVLQALRSIGHEDTVGMPQEYRLGRLRREFRTALRGEQLDHAPSFTAPLIAAAGSVGQALVGMTLDGLPLFLVPEAGVDVREVQSQPVHIRWDDQSWYIHSQAGTPLFSFDLPEHLFERYAKKGRLTERRALNLKEAALAEIQATVFTETSARVVRFSLDLQWVEQVREGIATRRAPPAE